MNISHSLQRASFERALRIHPRGAYTLIEIMLVLSIIVVLMGLGVGLLSGNLDFAKDTRVRSDLKTLKMQLQLYETMNLRLPTTQQGLKALVEKPSSPPEPRRWRQLLEREMVDPWDNTYQYVNPGRKNPNGYDLYSLGPDREESEDDMYLDDEKS